MADKVLERWSTDRDYLKSKLKKNSGCKLIVNVYFRGNLKIT